MSYEVTPEEQVRRAALLSRLTEIKTLFPGSTQHDPAPLRLALMAVLRYVDDEEVTAAILALCPPLILEEVR